MTRYVGRALPRVEDLRFITGRGCYTDDLSVDDQAYCVFLRSPHAHAHLRRIDSSAARAAPGALAVLTGADYVADGCAAMEHTPNPLDALDPTRRALTGAAEMRVVELPHWPLACDRVRHVGEPIVAVIARSALLARDAAERIEVEYEPLAVVVSPVEAARDGAPQLHADAPHNRCVGIEFGDAAATRRALATAACVVQHQFVQQRIASCQLEPRAAIGVYDAARQSYTLVSGSQGAVRQQSVLAAALRVPLDRVRVISPDVGGGFGPRTFLAPEQVIVAWAAKRVGRAVKWTSDRSEAFQSDYQGRDGVTRAALALDAEGHILGYQAEHFGNLGAYTVSFASLANLKSILTTVYRVPAAHLVLHGILTNTVPTAPYRGAGRPEAHHAIERLLDIAARRCGIDRLEIRRRNLVHRDMLPYRTAMGLTYDSGDFAGCMARVAAAADWTGFPARRAAAAARGRLAGIGVANHVEAPVGAPRERVEVTVRGAGTIEAIVGTQSTGQGHETSFAQVLADQLGVPFNVIRIHYGDTAFVKAGGGTHSDRSMRLVGSLLVDAAASIVESGRTAASAVLEAAAADIVFAAGRYLVAGTDRSISVFDVAQAIESMDISAGGRRTLTAASDCQGRIPAYPGGAAVCELEIDRGTGAVAVTRYTTVDDVGQPINPLIVCGQTHGGIVQGVGQALREAVAFERTNGQLLAGSLMDYAMLRADDVPPFEVSLAEDATASNPLRVKGGGEGGIVPATAAVVNALCDALADRGIEDVPMPATPETLWRAIHSR